VRRTTLAPRGQTPVLPQRHTHRQKVSVAAALWRTPGREQPRMHYGIYPDSYLEGEDYSQFLHEVVHDRLRDQLAVVLQDEGGLHRGEPMAEFLADHPWVQVELMPCHAPELNPVEAIWNYLKCHALANFAPENALHLGARLQDNLWIARGDASRLHTFFAASPLKW
jgi:transposase